MCGKCAIQIPREARQKALFLDEAHKGIPKVSVEGQIWGWGDGFSKSPIARTLTWHSSFLGLKENPLTTAKCAVSVRPKYQEKLDKNLCFLDEIHKGVPKVSVGGQIWGVWWLLQIPHCKDIGLAFLLLGP